MTSDQPSPVAVPVPGPTDPLLTEWRGVIEATPEHVRHAVSRYIESHLDALATRYIERTVLDPEAAPFILTARSRQEVGATARRWLNHLLCESDLSIEDKVAHQRQAGEALARMNYPINSVARGARKLRSWIVGGLESGGMAPVDIVQAATYISDLLDISIELRNGSYLTAVAGQSRTDEAYRMHSLGQNIAMERERQRASLMEWSHTVLVDLHRATDTPLPRMANSDFGLWFAHRAAAMFDGAAGIASIAAAAGRIDNEILPRLDPAGSRTALLVSEQVERLQAELAAIKFNVTALFEQNIEVEGGRDSLTRLLNRRFLPTVLNREVALHRRATGSTFSLLLLDIDNFKRINDQFGHDVGDLVLQHSAALVVGNVRPSDFVFRYGGEEILVVLVESDATAAARVAEKLRATFESTPCGVPNGQRVTVTVSVGVAVHEGRPDFLPLLKAADQALYRAKNEGRNRVVLTPPQMGDA
jgi:diguanylate cyclase